MTGDGLTNSVSESEGATSTAAGRQRSLARQPSPAEGGEGRSSRSHSPPFRQLQGKKELTFGPPVERVGKWFVE